MPGETVQPVWLTVHVPGDAAAGEYRGAVKVAGAAVPLRLTVSAYRLPGREHDGILMSIQQSPDAIAETCGVTPYSAEHLKRFDPEGKSGSRADSGS